MIKRLPEKLNSLRKHYKFSQEYLAGVLGISISDYMAIENGRAELNDELLFKLAKLYRIDEKEIRDDALEVTLYDTDDTTTDQINIEFFMKRNRWYRRLFRYIKRNRTVQYLMIIFILVCLVTMGLIVKYVNKPLIFDISESDRLSVSDNSVAFIGLDGNLKVTGKYSDVYEEKVLKVVCGDSFIATLKDDGSVGLYGSTVEDRTSVSSLKNIVDITAADDHIILTDKYGKIHTVGGNVSGELSIEEWKDVTGIKTFKNCTAATDSEGHLVWAGEPVGRSQFKNYANPLDYDANENMTVVVKNDGTVDYSAYNDHYASLMGWKDIVDVACGDDFVAGLKKDGTVVISSLDEEMVSEVKKWENISAIDAGKDYLIGFDGENIYGTGKNSFSQFEKEETVKEKSETIKPETLKVTIGEEYITVEFEPVKNAYGYQVSLVAGTTISYEIHESEKAKFPVTDLKENKYYTITIVSLGNEGYENSDPYEYIFEYIKPEIKQTEEEKVPVYHLVGKTRKEFESYLEQYGVNIESISSSEDEIDCSGDSEVITYVEGYEDGENITRSQLKERNISYRYCHLPLTLEEE